VRQRAGLSLLNAASFTRATLRTQLTHERATKLADENMCWFDLQRWDLFNHEADVNLLETHDSDFNTFVIGKSRLLPLLQTEVDPDNLQQNPHY
jgi:hypothetical protein